MKGSKLCCNTGECGACTVIYNGKPINSCVTLAADANGAEITTIEGLAEGDKLHPVQQAFIDTGAVQCGYCTPGYIMSVKALLDRTTKPTPADIEEAVSGNICRCTGYNKIVDAIHLAAQSSKQQTREEDDLPPRRKDAKFGGVFVYLSALAPLRENFLSEIGDQSWQKLNSKSSAAARPEWAASSASSARAFTAST